ncbi:hypothetical protein KIF59_14455 [Enterobacter cloacae subsp. cloacae]|nr:hypothetical protein [Enterobacter cloacae subsp. cloacae]
MGRCICDCCAARCRWCWTSTIYQFTLGQSRAAGEGDVLIIASGLMTMRAGGSKAAAYDNVSVAVLHSPTIKPLDEETILRS